MKWYGKTLRLRRGCSVAINLTYRCNFHCHYCNMILVTGNVPKVQKEMSMDYWQFFLRAFPVKVKEVFISGGEPTLIPWMPTFVTWLLEQGYHVTVFSNLFQYLNFFEIKPHYRFQISATYHHQDSKERFEIAYQALERRGFRLNVDEISDDKPKVFPHSRLKRMSLSGKDLQGHDLATPQFVAVPDGSLVVGCYRSYFEIDKNTQRPQSQATQR